MENKNPVSFILEKEMRGIKKKVLANRKRSVWKTLLK